MIKKANGRPAKNIVAKSKGSRLIADVLTFAATFCLLLLGAYTVYSLLDELLTGPGPFHGNHYDFLAFYGAAFLTLHGHIAQVYNADALINLQRQIVAHPVGAAGYMAYMNPPFTAVLLAPLALISFAKARLLWFVINVAMIAWIAIWLGKPLDTRSRIIGAFLLATTFPVYQALIEGQPSILILFGGILAYIAARKHKYVVSGICLSLLWIKPQFAVFALVGLIIMKQWRVIVSMIASVLAMMLIFLPITGPGPYFTYGHYLLSVVTDHFTGAGSVVPSVWYGALNTASGLNGFYTALFGQAQVHSVNVLTGVSALFLVVLFVVAIIKTKFSLHNAAGRLMLAAAIVMALLIDPHLYAQDVVLLYLVLPLLAGFGNYFRTILIVVFACNFIRVDQKISVHIFTLLAYIFVAAVFIRTIRYGLYNAKSAS